PLRHRSYRRYLGNARNPIYNAPRWTTEQQLATTDVNRYLFSTDVKIEPTDFLQVTLRGGIDGFDDKRSYFFPIGSGGDRQNGVFAEDVIGGREINFDGIVRGNFQLTPDIGGNATVGWNINDRQRTTNSSNITGFLVNARKETTDLNTSAANSTVENEKRFIRSNRLYAVLSLDFFNQLFVTASNTIEAHSAVDGNFSYPSVDAAWQFSELPVISTNSVFSFGKLRVAWGQLGVAPDPHRAQTLAEGGFEYSTYSDPLQIALFGGGFRLDDDRGNPGLDPEIKTEFEIGTDLRFFNDRLSYSFTFYQNNIEGMLLPIDLTPSSGFDTQFDNAADMENIGVEMDLTYTVVRNNDWNVDIYANWATNENEVTRLEGTETYNLSPGASVSSRAIVGKPLGELFGTGSQTNPDGSFDLDDNGFPQLTPSPITLGDPNPDWTGAIGVRANWKNVAFNILVDRSQGGFFSPRSLWVLRRFGTTQETANRFTTTTDLTNYAGNVIPAGTTVRGNIANFGGGDVLLDETWYRTGIGGGFGDNQAYNFSIEEATVTRVRELTLSYTLNSTAFRDFTKARSVTFSATARNLFHWDDIPGIDPEINQTGVGNARGLEYFTNPSTESYLFSIEVNF
ncbi:MAG: outer membrane beta-barrel protein, partial [Bacteroidota bacterium]